MSDDQAQTDLPREPREDYWCYNCQSVTTPMHTPNICCSRCYSDFVEQIDTADDPRNFVPQPEYEDDENPREGEEALGEGQVGPTPAEMVELIQNMLQQLLGPNSIAALRPLTERRDSEPEESSEEPSGTVSIIIEGQDDDQNRQGEEALEEGGEEDRRLARAESYTSNESTDDGRTPLISFTTFLEHLVDIANVVGNRRDYVWSQEELDSIITQLMEQTADRNRPPPASDDVIERLPRSKITKEQAEKGQECSVCKEEYQEGDSIIELPCKHFFHEDCVLPWLKTSGTCCICRFSLVGHPNTSRQPARRQSSSSERNS
ncbi:uncharacterized protein VTP21DRAFT_8649 [Calcarisporiella thermophila]|uniref:uncharacterized protein n=1 Tax=Calcarisporiella thermophila TaxID=911321 RepID=UPI0037433E6E